MSNNATKTPLAITMNNFVERKIQDALENLGKSFPCVVTAVNGPIVTVNFAVAQTSVFTTAQVTMPIAQPYYIRIPVQVGDTGLAVSADARLGGITGLGTGAAPNTGTTSLGALVFVPISNVNWPTLDPNAVVINAPNGSIIRTEDGTAIVQVQKNSITLTQGGSSITLSGGNVTITGTLIINGQAYLAHEHTGVKAGSDTSGGVA
jgi:hypothetical protein